MKVKALVYPTGMRVWRMPGSETLSIIWPGPGAGLMLAFDASKPGGAMTRINHPCADGQYHTVKEAQKAVDAFVALAEEAK